MTIVVCLDDKNGMMFNKRRQSKDRELIRNLTQLLQGQRLWMHPYSQGLFTDDAEGIEVRDDFLTAAPDDAVCFVENQDIRPCADRLDRLIVYRWNRHYPSDVRFPLELADFTLQSSTEFRGSSHDLITREEYTR